MTQINSIKEFIFWWKYEQGSTVRSLAAALGVVPATLYDWIRKDRIPIRHWKAAERVSQGNFKPGEIYF